MEVIKQHTHVNVRQGGRLGLSAIIGGPELIAPPSSGSALEVRDEGVSLTTTAASLDFVGTGVTATAVADAITVTVSSTSGALDDLTDVTITSPANADRLRYDSSASLWKNSSQVWEPMIASDGSVMTDGLLNPMMSEVAY